MNFKSVSLSLGGEDKLHKQFLQVITKKHAAAESEL